MKNRKLKITAGVIAACLIGLILFITNAFVGNPITAAFANSVVHKYVSKNYSQLDLDVSKAQYDFKDGNYTAKATSKTSKDTYFYISYRGGKVHYDSYNDYVLGKWNTMTRLEDECLQQIIPILSDIKEIDANNTYVDFKNNDNISTNKAIMLDMPYDKSLPIKINISLNADVEDTSFANIARLLEEIHKLAIDHGYVFSSYDINCESPPESVMVYGVSGDDIESGKLEELLLEGFKYEEEESEKQKNKVIIEGVDKEPMLENRISVSIKKNE